MSKKVLCLLADGFEEAEAITPVDLLRRAGFSVTTCGLNSQGVKASHGLEVKADTVLAEVLDQEFDCLYLPGGAGHVHFLEDERVMALIRKYAEDESRVLAAICASPTILGRMGYLKGRNYTCFTSMNADFGGTYHHVPVVADGHILTGRSMAAAVDMGLLMIEKMGGEELCLKIKESIYY